MVELLPHIDAGLNLLATILLVLAFIQIKKGNIALHKKLMLSAFCCSIAFLACYLVYHFNVGSKPFPKEKYPTAYLVYLPILATHVILAMFVPFLAIGSLYLGLKDKRAAHRKLSKFTFPIWLYVSVTGVVVYVMLYWLFKP